MWRRYEAAFDQAREGQRDLMLLRWGAHGSFMGVYAVPVASGEPRVHSGRWACAMVQAVSRHRLSAARDVWLYASDVVRPFPWPRHTAAARQKSCKSALLAPTAPLGGAACTWLMPTPYELMAAEKLERLHRSAPEPPGWPLLPFAERRPLLFFRAGWAWPRKAILEMASRAEHATWLNASVVRRARADESAGSERVPESEFGRYRYLLDIGGVSGTTWSALRLKLLTGSLVFKVELPWADWWHQALQPWRDYVPVREDLSDLHRHFLWAESNPQMAERIASSGASVAASSATVDAVRAGVAAALQQIDSHAAHDEAGITQREPALRRFDPCQLPSGGRQQVRGSERGSTKPSWPASWSRPLRRPERGTPVLG